MSSVSETFFRARGFQRRTCPLCRSDRRELLLDLEPREFCDVNSTYEPTYAQLLALPSGVTFPIERCSDCAFVYAGWLPDAAFLSKVYESVINPERAGASARERKDLARRLDYLSRLLSMRRWSESDRALDYGCSFGATSRLLANCGFPVVAYDPSAVRNDAVRTIGAAITITADEAEALAQGPYQAVIVDNVLEHVPDPVGTAGRLADAAASDALLVISVPSFEPHVLAGIAALRQRGAPINRAVNPWEHLNYFDLAHLDALMKRTGFVRVVDTPATGGPDIGLRLEGSRRGRLKNAAATAIRLLRFAMSGESTGNVNLRFYRRQV